MSKQQIEQWAQETEIGAGTGAIRKGGNWKVYLTEASTQDAALGVYDDLRNSGYAAEIRPATTAAGRVYRVRVANLPNRIEAEALGAKLKGRMGVAEPKVSM